MAWSQTRALLAAFLVVCFSLMLSACGGGGGGDKPATTAATDPNAGGPSTDGAFSLSRTAVTAGVVQTSFSSATETVDISSNDSRVAGYAIGYAPGVTPPSWLTPSVSAGQGLDRQIILSFYSGALAPGVYRTSLRIAAGDRNANILGYKDIAVTLTVLGPTSSGSGTGSASTGTTTSTTTTGSSTPTAVVQAKLTATPSSLALQSLEGDSALTESTIAIVSDSKEAVTAIVASESFEAGGSPWLLASSAERTADGWTLRVRTSSSASVGIHRAKVRLTTLDIDGRVNGSIDVPVTRTVRGRLYVSLASSSVLGGVAGEARSVGATLFVEAPGLNWSTGVLGGPAGAVVGGPATGTDNGVVLLAIDLSKSAPASGTLSATVTTDDGQTATVTVPYVVEVPTLGLSRSAINVSAINGVDIAPLSTTMGVNNGTDPEATVSSDAAWLQVVRTGTTLNAGFALKADASVGPLASGTYQANVTVSTVAGGVKLTKTLPFKLVLTPATLGTTVTALEFGGSKGRDLSNRGFGVTLSNGLTPPSWSVVSSPSWIKLSRTSGNFTATTGVDASFTASALLTGVTKGYVVLLTKVNGDTLTATLPVTVQLDAHRLLPAEIGVAFSKVQAWSRLTRQIPVRDNMGLATPWTASSSQPWLKVTPSGKAGDSITLTADPQGLTSDQLQTATVTITSTDKTVVAVEPIQVGLWVGSSKLSTITSIPWSQAEFFVVDPIRPYFYATTTKGTDVVVYNIYTGLAVDRLKGVVTNATGGLVSPDGARLYLKDGTETVVIDLVAKVKQATWAVDLDIRHALYARPNGKGMLLTGAQAVDALTGSVLDQSPFPGSLDCAMGAELTAIHCQDEGISPSGVVNGWIDHTLATKPSLKHGTTASLNQALMGSNGQDVAVSPNGSRLAVASGAPYVFPVYDLSALTLVQTLGGDAYPNNVEYGSDGRLFAGAATSYGNTDLWVYREDGTLHSSYLVRGYALNMLQGGLRVSGDAMLAIVSTEERLLKIVPIGP